MAVFFKYSLWYNNFMQITSPQHSLVKHLVKLRKNRDYRYDHHSILVEGSKILTELPSNIEVKTVFTTCDSLIPSKLGGEHYLTTPENLQKISGQMNPEGILAEISMPIHEMPTTIQRLIIFDHIADPGNLGTLLRTALAFQWDAAYLLDGSCDPYNDKALTAARGATFKLPFIQGDQEQLKSLLEQHQIESYVADLDGTPLKECNPSGPVALILGNEAHGPTPESKNRSTAVHIPIAVESLNVAVAGGILMHHLRKDTHG